MPWSAEIKIFLDTEMLVASFRIVSRFCLAHLIFVL